MIAPRAPCCVLLPNSREYSFSLFVTARRRTSGQGAKIRLPTPPHWRHRRTGRRQPEVLPARGYARRPLRQKRRTKRMRTILDGKSLVLASACILVFVGIL